MAIELIAEVRADFGKQKMKKLRALNRLPANMYGGPLPAPRAITLDLHQTELLLKANGGKADYRVVLEGRSYPVTIKEARTEPIYRHLLHLDFLVHTDA